MAHSPAIAAVYVMWIRELKRYSRSRTHLIASLGQPLMYLLAFGFGFQATFEHAGRGPYMQFLVPGVIAMTVLFTAVFSGVGLLWDRQFGFLKESLVAPVPRVCVLAGRTLGGSTVAAFHGVFVLAVSASLGLCAIPFTQFPRTIAFIWLIALVYAAFGAVVGCWIEDMPAFQPVLNFVVMPTFFFSGALFPLDDLPSPLRIVAQLNPLAHGVSALRSSFLDLEGIHLGREALVLVWTGTVVWALAIRLFSRLQI